MIKGSVLRDSMISGAINIKNQRAIVDELNVFPVPDGDTGINMSMTINAARQELELLPDDVTVEETSRVAASAMLRGARGNSGVILSLLFRGFSKALVEKKEASAQDILNALQKGVEAAYKAVMKPTEGTILTVARVASEQANESNIDDTVKLWDCIVDNAQIALDDTPNLLPVLKKAGVVDAGGYGLLVIFKGMQQVFQTGVIITEEEVKVKKKSSNSAGKGIFTEDLMKVEDIVNGYCTEFIVNKTDDANAVKLRAFLESNGDSVVVVDDDDFIKVHIHTQDPGKIFSNAISHGWLTNMKIENMHEQFLTRQKQGKGLEKQAKAEKEALSTSNEFVYCAVDEDTEFGFVAVAAGEGLSNIFLDLGANAVISGGQTMNPSTANIVSAVQSVGAKTVFVLPNNKNIIMAAEQACKIADRKIIVLPTRTIPQGITAMLNFDPDSSVKDNTIAMMGAADNVATGLITFAARDSDFDGHKIKKGEILALENGKLVFTSRDISHAVVKLTKNMVKKSSSFVTLISGCDIDVKDSEAVSTAVQNKVGSNIEVTSLNGGQPVYYYIISVE